MLKQRAVNGNLAKGARGLGVVVALSIGISACGAGHAVTDAVGVARMAAQRVTSGTPSMPADITVPAGQPPAPASPATAATAPKATATLAAPAKGSVSATHPAAVKATGAPAAVVATPAAAAAAATATKSALPVRRQPTAIEIGKAIKAVHQLVPFFTPTAKQVAHVGDQVCSALDQGMTVSQVKSKITAMLGHLSWLLPSAVAAQGVRTVVNLYCPGYASKVA
jgi:hypothetical protein